MKIEVSDKHISRGKRDDCEHCPVALAVSEKTGKPVRATLKLIVISADRLQWFPTPLIAAAFIRAFDQGHSVEPFSFDLGKSA